MRKGGTIAGASIVLALSLVFGPPASGADCNRNGVEDWIEVSGGSQPDCNGNDIPDPCDLLPVNYGLATRGGLSAGFQIVSAVAADLDGDGAVDLAAPAAFFPAVGILWNGGRGSFAEPDVVSIEGVSTGIAAADVAGDLRQDLVFTTSTGISALINLGGQRFSTAALEIDPVNLPLRAPVLADIDGDGDNDLAVLGAFRVLIFRNQGTGFFAAPEPPLPIGSNPVALAAARLDGDGDLDLITANRLEPPGVADNVSVLLNRGDGTFDSPRNFAAGRGASSISMGDIDGDGDADAVTASLQSGAISVLLGAGDGSFTRGRDVAVDGSPRFASLGDVDLDGDLDLCLSWLDLRGSGLVGVRLNHGDGTFAGALEFPSLIPPDPLVIADLTGDGSPEIVAVLTATELGSLLVLERVAAARDTDCDRSGVPDGCELEGRDCNGNGFVDACDIALGLSFDCDRNGVPDDCDPDCDGDGAPDACELAAGASPDCNANGVPDECDVGPPLPRFEPRWLELVRSQVHLLGTADLDADGRADIFGAGFFSTIAVFWGKGDGSFEPPVDFPAGGSFGNIIGSIEAGDIDGDRDLDLIASRDGGLVLVLEQEARSFAITMSIETAGFSSPLALGDLEGDGDLDIAVAINARAAFLANDGSGVFSLLAEPGIPLIPGILLLSDLDGDGKVDLVARNPQTGFLRVFWNEVGRFVVDGDLGRGPPTSTVVSASDVDGDGDRDLVSVLPNGFSLARQEAPRRFEVVDFVSGLSAFGLRANDLDADGDVDLVFPATLADGTQRLFVMRNAGASTFDDPIGLFVDATLGALTSGDYDGDGAIDVAAAGERPCLNCSQLLLVTLLNRTQPAASADADGNGRPDECDSGAFRRGDPGGDGGVDLADAVFTLRALFQGGPAPDCAEAADADNDGKVDLTDPVLILDYLFRGGPPPAPPGPESCGLDPDAASPPGDLGCGSYGSC